MEIKIVGVVGCGLMGSGIAEVCARSGFSVVVREINPELLQKGLDRIQSSMAKAVERGKLSAADRDAAWVRIRGTTEMKEFAGCDVVVEAVVENMEEKKKVFADLDRIAGPYTVLASNTSSLSITAMASATHRPERVLGMHFFNPVPRAVEAGLATKEDIDMGVKLGLNHPMGPITLLDFVGLDTTLFIADAMYAELKDSRYAAPPLLRQMVTAGRLGRKVGKGFYDYS
ncbi:MAG: 3-hydroxybutyryl-CoA dehydrogenase [Chloroflexi bacterium]|nr:3-hydroxybutyryl-CoA dehydrogenase [Chloroflexota bacterium]